LLIIVALKLAGGLRLFLPNADYSGLLLAIQFISAADYCAVYSHSG
jgi:hypothetical protein